MKAKCFIAASAASLIVGFLGSRASAQGIDEFGAYGGLEDRKYRESPQNVAAELRIGRYVPRIDSQFKNAAPYREIFGDGNRYIVGLEVDWQALRIPFLGTLGPGFGWGMTKSGGKALLPDSGGARADQSTSLTIMPMYAVAVLRADVITR